MSTICSESFGRGQCQEPQAPAIGAEICRLFREGL
jgi:hypothetical protein